MTLDRGNYRRCDIEESFSRKSKVFGSIKLKKLMVVKKKNSIFSKKGAI